MPRKKTPTTVLIRDPTLANPWLSQRLAPRSICGALNFGAIPDRAGHLSDSETALLPPDEIAAARIAGLNQASIQLILAETRDAADRVACRLPLGTRPCWAGILDQLRSRQDTSPPAAYAAAGLELGDLRALHWLAQISPCPVIILHAASMIAAGEKPPDDPADPGNEDYLRRRSPWHRLAFGADVWTQVIAKLCHGRVTPVDLHRYLEYHIIHWSKISWCLRPREEREYRELAMQIFEAALAHTAARS